MGDWQVNEKAPQMHNVAPSLPGSIMGEMMLVGAGTSIVPGTANAAIYIPCTLQKRFITGRFYWINGGAVAGNVDMGLFDLSGNKLESTGATAAAGTSTLQSVIGAGNAIPAGSYYLGIMWTSATQSFIAGTSPHTAFNAAAGILMQTGLGATLPSPATMITSTQSFIPHIGMCSTQFR